MYSPQQQALLDLQACDTEARAAVHAYETHAIHDFGRKLDAFIAEVTERLEQATAQVEEEQARLAAMQDESAASRATMEAKRLELVQLKDARTVQAMTRDIEALERRIAKIEHDELTRMEAVEAAEQAVTALQEKLAPATAKKEEFNVQLAKLQAALKNKLAVIAARRAEKVDLLDPALLNRYRQAVEEKKGIVVGEFKNDRCTLCRVGLASTQVAAIREHAGDVTVCPSCRRLLVVDTLA